MAYTLQELMKSVSDNYGIEELVPDDDGVYTLDCDGLPLMIFSLPEEDKVVFFAQVAEKPAQGEQKLAQILLQLNHHFQGSQGSVFSQDPETGNFALERWETLSAQTDTSFPDILATFIRTAQKWMLLIANYDPDNSQDSTYEPTETSEGAPALSSSEDETSSQIPAGWISV